MGDNNVPKPPPGVHPDRWRYLSAGQRDHERRFAETRDRIGARVAGRARRAAQRVEAADELEALRLSEADDAPTLSPATLHRVHEEIDRDPYARFFRALPGMPLVQLRLVLTPREYEVLTTVAPLVAEGYSEREACELAVQGSKRSPETARKLLQRAKAKVEGISAA